MKGLTQQIDLKGMDSRAGISIAITTENNGDSDDSDINDPGVAYSISVNQNSFFYLSDGVSVSSSVTNLVK